MANRPVVITTYREGDSEVAILANQMRVGRLRPKEGVLDDPGEEWELTSLSPAAFSPMEFEAGDEREATETAREIVLAHFREYPELAP